MSDVTCRGSFALGTACGRCSKCKAQIEEYEVKKTARESLDGTAAFKSQIAALQARLAEVEKDQIEMIKRYDAMTRLVEQTETRAERAEAQLATARRDALEEAAYVEGFEDGLIEAKERAIRPYDKQTPQQSWVTSDTANALAAFNTGGKDDSAHDSR